METYEDYDWLIEFTKMEKFNVIIKGDNTPITEKQWGTINIAAKLMQDAGLATLITRFYVDGLKKDDK